MSAVRTPHGMGIGPVCHACASPATIHRQSCGALSCAVHVHGTYVTGGDSNRYELRCTRCQSTAMVWRIVSGILFVVAVVSMLVSMARKGEGLFAW